MKFSFVFNFIQQGKNILINDMKLKDYYWQLHWMMIFDISYNLLCFKVMVDSVLGRFFMGTEIIIIL